MGGRNCSDDQEAAFRAAFTESTKENSRRKQPAHKCARHHRHGHVTRRWKSQGSPSRHSTACHSTG